MHLRDADVRGDLTLREVIDEGQLKDHLLAGDLAIHRMFDERRHEWHGQCTE